MNKLTIKFLKVIIMGLILPLILFGCKEYPELVPVLNGIPSGGVLGSGVDSVSKNSSVVYFTLDLFAVNALGKFISRLTPDNFSASSDQADSVRNISIDYTQDEFIGSYSAGLLMDQSGSILSTDPQDARVQAGKGFIEVMSSGDEAALSVFTSGGFYPSFYNLLVPFTKDKKSLKTEIDKLVGKATGGTPLFLSINEMVNYTAANGFNTNKAVIAFTDGVDTDGGININTLITNAVSKKVKVYTVGLGQDVNNDELQSIAIETGGAVMVANDALQLISLYSSLGELLNGSAYFYRTRWKAVKNRGQWKTGDVFNVQIVVSLPDGTDLFYPVRLRVV